MANSFVRYTGNGSTDVYAVSFPYRSQSDITVTIDGVATTAFTWNGAGTQITFTSPPGNLTSIQIKRTTSQTSRLVDYAAGSVLTENDLDTDSTQAFYMGQEAVDEANDRIIFDIADFNWDAQSKRIKNVADPTALQDAVTKNYLENTYLTSAVIANINTLAPISANITTVAGMSSAINTVNSNASNINTVAAADANVTLVGANIASVNTVATNIVKVVAVADDLAEAVSEVVTVADDLNEATSEIDTVATNIANVNTVGLAIANVNLVGGSITNVNTVATNLAAVNSFANTYRIASSAPVSSLDVGDLYFDTTANELKVYKSSGWAAAGSTVNGTSARFNYTATAAQTTFTGADTNGETLAYDAGFADVYLNGVRLSGADITITSGTSVVLAVGASAGDILDVVAYGTFSVASIAASAITSGTINEARLPASALGAVWESKSNDFTAEARKNYFCDTSSNDIDVTLPAGTIGDTIRFLDATGTFDTNDLTILYGSSKIQGASANLDVATERAAFGLVYYNATQGWLLTEK